jgi:hypothetical protein
MKQMATVRISVSLDPEVAQVYRAASVDKKKKIRSLLRLWLREVTVSPGKPLPLLMDEISDKAQERGMTPRNLESLLDAD